MKIIKYKVGDLIELKKPHPCGGKEFRVLRVGGDMRVVCVACGRDMNIDRLKLEKATKRIISSENDKDDASQKGDRI
ncbi:MAG: DUF951 domain-containing protein [Ruminococcaceae bacterium]|nr:DUF951 domain-containing protein [Oscillospiraceae bacterium]